ncbi:hypothetical protein [Castellaniella defragrans]|uniref:hypothetical protein n=1 Tax=Castellaniella defragrans TaxID=75697 RepID=UPI002AFF678A|nr:hypothetical protein [Castellaniella defragrans]
MKTSLKASAVCISLGLLLSGCSDSEVSSVKATVYPLDKTLTYEAALSGRKACSDTKWSTSKDDANRIIVQYRCELGNTKSALQEARDLKIKDANELMASGIENLNVSIEQSKAFLKSSQDEIQSLQAKLDKAQSETDQYRATLSPKEQALLVFCLINFDS